MGIRLVSTGLWAAAFFLTVILAVFQRLTGPTYPLREQVELAGETVSLKLLRTHPGAGGLPVSLEIPAGVPSQLQGVVRWRRFPTREPWQELVMVRGGTSLQAELPHLPPAGKIEYAIMLELPGGSAQVLGEPVVARYRNEVAAGVLVPHILCMFLSMLLATRAMLGRLAGADERRVVILLAMVLLLAGGALLGPLVQKQAFGAYWTGWPLGEDLTDNKTMVAIFAWLPATVLALRRKRTRWSVIIGWLVMMGIFMIPHSLRGSQIDWSQQQAAPATRTPQHRPS